MVLAPFSPLAGLVSDDTPFSREGRWTDGNNVRFRAGKAEVIGGWSNFHTLTSGKCVSICMVRHAGGTEYVVYGTDIGLWAGPGIGTPNDYTPAVFGTGVQRWSIQSFGSLVLACPQNGTLYVTDLITDATEVPAAPDQISWMLVTPERQVLAFGCNEEVSGAFNPMCIRG